MSGLMNIECKAMDDGNLQTTDDEIAKRLFTPSPGGTRRIRSYHSSPEKSATKRDPLHRYRWTWASSGDAQRRDNYQIGLLGALVFFILCLSAVLVTVWLNYHEEWSSVTLEDVTKFFSNEPLKSHSRSIGGFYYLHKLRPLLGLFGALPVALILGVCSCVFTCLLMFYDSDVPGNFPPTPVSPRKQEGCISPSNRWHLGYIFAFVNFFVAFSLTLFHLRWNMQLPLYPQV